MAETTGNKDAVSVLAPLLRPTEEASPLVLLGAGASFRSGVPTAADAVRQIARLMYSERELKNARPPERVKPSEYESWLRGFTWFIPGPDRLAENFPALVEHLLVPAEFRKRVLLDLLRPVHGISNGYKLLADFVMRGLVRTVFTTNFDTCLPDALRERQPHIRHVSEVNRSPGEYDQFNVYSKCQIIWLHGRAENYSDKNAEGEIGSLDPKLVSLVRPMLNASPIIVVGYRGSEPSIMDGLFGQSKAGRLDFSNGVYWCTRHGENLHPHVEALAQRLGSNFQLLRIDGFDEMLADLATELAGQDRYAVGAAGMSPHDVRAFDEHITEHATLDDLDLDLALSVLREYCQKLGRAALTRETLPALMREQGLIVSDANGDRVTAGALLLFGKRTQDFFPHAVVALTEAGKKRMIYEGNLISQHRRLLERLESADVNPQLKLKKRRQHSDQPAYPPRVLVELLVNMLVHRDYQMPEPSTIELRPGSEIVFTNPGALTLKVSGKVTVEDDGRVIFSEGITDQRNPSLCDIFFGLSAMERAGTGLMDVGELMLTGGGGSAFYSNVSEACFKAVVTQPAASAGSRLVARSDVPTGVYVLNVLPFGAVPETVSIVRLTTSWRDRPSTVDFRDCGTFVARDFELWSFVPLPILTSLLDPIVDKSASRSVPRKEIEASPDAKRLLSWLLRKHVERKLESFKEQDGLILEQGRKHRAYFAGKDGAERMIVWNSVQRRGNRREVVKRRGDHPRAWFENEGFGYEIVDLGGIWCVRIKPFYMFTGPDAVTPLPVFARTAKATRRIKFDRNKSVEADLTFWAIFLGRGAETMNVGDHHVDDLLIDMAFLTVEVPETGLIHEPEHQDRMLA
ncbi:MAG TPA: SIR2 family protein [Polyangiaceae bacterium]|nr:SIR2 family protein [Polyangiaceae bacterium]